MNVLKSATQSFPLMSFNCKWYSDWWLQFHMPHTGTSF